MMTGVGPTLLQWSDKEFGVGMGQVPGEGSGDPFQYSCLGNSMNRGAWWATVYGAARSRT